MVCITSPAKQLPYSELKDWTMCVAHPILPAQVPGASDAGVTQGVHSRLSAVESWAPRGVSRHDSAVRVAFPVASVTNEAASSTHISRTG
ncbi:hypothetical protein V498_09876 [Pseudogymnoascus sp. VKM F-4517 (FW-2822)]|nr:hypothetical protein V498_09876 [Pseudogymnoascus sp. VKM F-4517 (FW-2822)]